MNDKGYSGVSFPPGKIGRVETPSHDDISTGLLSSGVSLDLGLQTSSRKPWLLFFLLVFG